MRKTTKAVSAILAVVMLIGVMMCAPFGVSAAETYGDFEYSLNDDNTCTITKYNGSASDLTIPSEIQGHKVIGISECGASPDYMLDSYGAFENCKSLTSVTIPDGVTGIGESAFCNCTSLTSITISDSVKGIGNWAFCGCTNLTDIKIPGSVTWISNWAFIGCTSLTSITISDSVTWIGERAFYNCTSLENIDIPDSKIILGPCRDACGIGGECFSRTKWEENQPEGVIYAGKIAYSYKGDMPENTEITLKSGTKGIAEYAFYGRKNLASITIPDSVTWIGQEAFEDCTNLTSLTIPDGVISIGDLAFFNCTSLTSITIPSSVTSIGYEAFEYCESLTSITIPDSVTSIGKYAFWNCDNLTIYGYENSYAQEYALNNDIPFVAIAGDYTFIKKHLEFIGDENANNTYHNQLKYFDVAKIALEDYGDLDNTYKLWKAVRGEIFENPYYTVLSDMVISESTAQGQLESFDIHLDSEFISVENDIIGLINSKVDLTPSQESKIKNMFKNRDFSDETTFKFCQDVLNNKVSKDELNSIFNAYDKTNTFLDVYNQGADIVESVYDTMNYSAILKAYENTSDEFKVVLMQMAYACQTENPWLYTAIEKYLNSDYDTEMRNKIVEEVAENGLNIGKALFKDSIESKVKTFLISNMDLSKVGTSVASGILAFVEGCKIGYAIGTGIDNLLFSTDDVSNSFVAASATAKTAGYLKYVLETNEANLRNNPILKNTVLFCETYNMYKNIQLNTADTMIKYFSKNQSALINQVFKGNNISYENEIYNWQILKLNWQNSSCHKGYILNSSIKNITVACPVNITVYNNAGEIVLEIADNAIKTDNGDVVATVCNNIKYVTLPDDSYNIKITATDDGTMSYSVCDLNVLENTSKTTCFENIKINKNSEYSGKVVSGSEYKQDDIALCNNNQKVSCKVSSYTNKNKVAVSNIKLSSSSLSLLIGEQHTISAGVAPQNASNKSVTWYSENPEIAKVDEYGNVTAVSSGKTKIVCVSLEDNIKSECDVEVKCPFGDVNGDGEITIEDATLIQKAVAGIATFDADQKVLADVNGDGEVSVFDVTLIQKYIVGGYSNTGNVGKPANV
ncbi:MAG: leucine-rich repeat protein [Ruminococcus bromii]|nr:leucine-rich repeat protein [Ruminococcus bromii]